MYIPGPLPVKLKTVVEGNKSPRPAKGLSSESRGDCRDSTCMPDCTGDFGIVVAGYKPPGTLGIARCQSHLHVLWETKHS